MIKAPETGAFGSLDNLSVLFSEILTRNGVITGIAFMRTILQYFLRNPSLSLDAAKQVPVQTPSLTPDLLDAAFSSASVPNNSAQTLGQGFGQDMFDKAFGAPDPNPFGAPMVRKLDQ